MAQYAITVRGMTCPGCERIVEEEVAAIADVADASALVDADRLVVEGPRDTVGQVREAVEALGYDVVS
jgi:copper chaperone CopZ